MTDLAPPRGDTVAVPGEPSSLADELGRLSRVMHAVKSTITNGPTAEARERAAHVLLFPLITSGPLRQGALADLVHADPSTISRHVTLLVDRGLVQRVADDADGRVSRLVITDTGRDVVHRLRAERDAVIERSTRTWSADERAAFARQLRRFVDDLADTLPTPGGAAAVPTPAERDR